MIENENQKTELLGNIAYTISKYYLVIGDYETALSEVEKSWNYYNLIGNDDKIIKLYNLKGIILRYNGRNEDAISVFQEGLSKSKICGNNAHVVCNCLSLAELYIDSNNFSMASHMINEAQKYAEAITDPILDDRLIEIKNELALRDGSNNG